MVRSLSSRMGLGRDLQLDSAGRLFDARLRELIGRRPERKDQARTEFAEAAFALQVAARRLKASAEEAIADLDLSDGRFRVLMALSFEVQDQGITLGDLAQWLEATPTNVTGLVDALEQQGLVERTRDAEDRRVVWARLTEQGRRVVTQAKSCSSENYQRLLGVLSAEERAQLRHLCLKIAQAASVTEDELHA